jgi:hypothetical protein
MGFISADVTGLLVQRRSSAAPARPRCSCSTIFLPMPQYVDAIAELVGAAKRQDFLALARPDERIAPQGKGGSVLAPITILAPHIVSVHHWDRLLGGLLYAVTPRIDWATLLRRSMAVDALQCPKCDGTLRVLAVITDREPVQRILSHLGMPTRPPARSSGTGPERGCRGRLERIATLARQLRDHPRGPMLSNDEGQRTRSTDDLERTSDEIPQDAWPRSPNAEHARWRRRVRQTGHLRLPRLHSPLEHEPDDGQVGREDANSSRPLPANAEADLAVVQG